MRCLIIAKSAEAFNTRKAGLVIERFCFMGDC